MKRILLAFAYVAALSACGQGSSRSGAGAGASNEACALVSNPAAIFGEGVEQVGYGGLENIAASCELQSADGARSGEVLIFTPASLGSVTAEANFAETVEKWDALTETPPAPVEGLGEDARIATDLPGYQTQIVFRQNGNVIAVMGSSGDSAVSGEQIARALAQSASQSLAAAN